jgi:L-ascorbate metabolism protein UlaG (beta-lactamase superfamily)
LILSPRTSAQKKRAPHRFITDVILPALFSRKRGQRNHLPPVFPKLKAGQICITWIGHASFLIQGPHGNILVDPNWANWLLVVRRLRHAGLAHHHLPTIDLVLITHAHFDHLNRKSLRQIAANQPIVVPAGVGDLVHGLGFEKVYEINWWERLRFPGAAITFVPAKHWGARKVTDHHRGYGGYVIDMGGRTIYHAGDSGYFPGFREIGKKFRPEVALLPIGAYHGPKFGENHMTPEQALRAFGDLRSKFLVPMHFGTYRLSYEPLHEPPQRLMEEATRAGRLSDVRFLIEGMPTLF